MDLELTQEQLELRSLASELLAQRVPREAPRAYLEGAGDAAGLWAELAELGWYGVGLDDDDAFGVPGLCVLAEQLGRRLASSVLVDVAVAARVVAAAPDRVRTAWLDRLLDGTATVSLAMTEGVETIASPDASGGVHVSGTKLGVQHGNAVAAFGVPASLDGECVFVLVRADRPGVKIAAEHGLDASACAARLVLNDVAVGADSVVADADAIARAFAVGAVATAAEAVGDAHVLRETAWSAVLYAAAALDEETPDAAEATTIAKAYVSRAARTVVEHALQVFGGIGFTWEHDLHLFLRRVLACEQRFGDALFHERQLAASLASRAEDLLAASSGRRLQ